MPFDDTIYPLTPEDRASLARATATLDTLKQLRVAKLQVSTFTGLATFALASYLQLWVHRVVYLAEGAESEWNARRPMNATVLLRSLMETVAGFHHLLEHGERDLESENLRSFHDRVLKAMYGSRQMRLSHPAMPEATNVLTLIDRLDKQFPGARRYYDTLCEVSHPNADGMVLFGELDRERVEMVFSESHDSAGFMVRHVRAGLRMLEVSAQCLHRCGVLAPRVVELEAKYGQHPDQWSDAKNGA